MIERATDSLDVAALKERLREFAAERDWGQYHDAKNLTMALAVEVGELLEHFQWLTSDEARDFSSHVKSGDVADEIADVTIYLVRLADVLGIDLGEVTDAKVIRNADRFPVDRRTS